MDELFAIRGINPATRSVVELRLRAPNAMEAKRQAEIAGLEQVTVSADLGDQGAAGLEGGVSSPEQSPEVLVVDDREDVQYVLMRMLVYEGYGAVGAADGHDALAVMARSKPALVIMDCHMPRMNGIEAIREIRGNKDLCGIPIIMFSASGQEAREEAMRAGANAFVEKNSMDWPKLHKEIVKLVGPGRGKNRVPNVRAKEDRNVS